MPIRDIRTPYNSPTILTSHYLTLPKPLSLLESGVQTLARAFAL